MKEEQLLNDLRINFGNIVPAGFHIEFQPSGNSQNIDFIARASYKDIDFEICGEVVSNESFSIFQKKIAHLKNFISGRPETLPIIISNYLSEKKRKYCKEESVAFIDLSGNVFLEFQSVYIERVGFSNKYPEKRKGRSPFSDKASLIVRFLFNKRDEYFGIRAIAAKINVNAGFVSRIVKELELRELVIKKDSKVKIREPQAVLEDWVNIYDYKKNHIAPFFCLAEGPEDIFKRLRNLDKNRHLNYALSVQAGANIVSPFSVFNEVHVYVDNDSFHKMIDSLELQHVEQGANVYLMLPYYKNSVFYEKQSHKGLWLVSDLQLYLDLYHYPLRGLEQAEKILNDRLLKD